ncbi:FecCD family ABC transporter permease [Thiolapillus brandeum]|uniref:Iron complex transporter permease protein n=1 Tax=Thiolapillus brandeum TaxID=1076588 RepID=A0A7U6JGN5_9GAMM|nr:iron ABC transporter permease [Thiolapillus brandeum]BAO43734.1 iron complex transporter permease protein [Thiolapillus brandeum]
MRHPLRNKLPLLVLLLAITLISLTISLMIGSADISPGELWTLLWRNDGSIHYRIIHELRLPRTLSAFAVGGVLALAGLLMQALLRNPLADPYILGVSGGAAVAVLGAMLLGLPFTWQAPMAFGGALASILLLFGLAHSGDWNNNRLLLTGVVLAMGWSALISFVLSLSPPVQLPGMLFWLMGDLSDALNPLLPLSVLGIGVLLSLWLAPALNLALLGSARAASLGVRIHRLHVFIYLLASLLTAAAVSIAGAIGFIGLISPHMLRLAAGSDHRILVPGTALLGGSLLVLADTAARTLIAPMQLPVGVLTALLGVPLFLFLLNRGLPGRTS